MTYLLYMKRSFTRSPRRHAVLLAVLTCALLLPLLISIYRDSNVFNTISTNISLRRREFAMLKSVGMTQKGFRWMMNYECLLYGSKALLLGLPVSCGITYACRHQGWADQACHCKGHEPLWARLSPSGNVYRCCFPGVWRSFHCRQ